MVTYHLPTYSLRHLNQFRHYLNLHLYQILKLFVLIDCYHITLLLPRSLLEAHFHLSISQRTDLGMANCRSTNTSCNTLALLVLSFIFRELSFSKHWHSIFQAKAPQAMSYRLSALVLPHELIYRVLSHA